MPAAFALAWGVLLGWASGGRFAHLEHAEMRYPAALVIAFLIQGMARGRIGVAGSETWGVFAWAAVSLVLLVLLLVQPRNTMVVIVAIGIAANVLVVLLNGYMPVFVPLSGAPPGHWPLGFYGAGLTTTVMPALGDCLPMSLVGSTFMLSLGDVLLIAGTAGFIASGMSQTGNSIHKYE